MSDMRAATRSVHAAIAADGVTLTGNLELPPHAKGVVLFAHGSGSSRLSPRNIFVGDVLRTAGVGTLLLDLLTAEEANDRDKVFDVRLLALRLLHATDWVESQIETTGLPVGYFGASTGAAAAIVAATQSGHVLRALVSRGGRPDLAMEFLPSVTVPTLLMVGSEDTVVLERNRKALERLGGTKQLVVIDGATHLFEEPGTLEQVAQLAAEWFGRYLKKD
jgi:alpha-beta hydrolase superfamily lysophospholipase